MSRTGQIKGVRDVSDLATLASAVRSARKRRGWFQPDLAKAAQVSLGVVNNLERGKTKPQPANLRAILTALDIEPEDIAGPADDEDARDWPRDIATVLDVMGMYLLSIPDDRRRDEILSITRDVFNRARAQGPF
jgi:transcriptional regulator with XRE-family HTH domain